MQKFNQLKVFDFNYDKKSFSIFLNEKEYDKIHKGIIKIKNEKTKNEQLFAFLKETDEHKIFLNEELNIVLTFLKK